MIKLWNIWKSMKEAPRDGTWVLLYVSYVMYIGRWNPRHWEELGTYEWEVLAVPSPDDYDWWNDPERAAEIEGDEDAWRNWFSDDGVSGWLPLGEQVQED